jgi:aerobic-type carbon monoxide dehydrogenase small subunit (CoxS/CutS family)
MSGNICRCGAYTNIVTAIREAISRGIDDHAAIEQAVDAIREDAERGA